MYLYFIIWKIEFRNYLTSCLQLLLKIFLPSCSVRSNNLSTCSRTCFWLPYLLGNQLMVASAFLALKTLLNNLMSSIPATIRSRNILLEIAMYTCMLGVVRSTVVALWTPGQQVERWILHQGHDS